MNLISSNINEMYLKTAYLTSVVYLLKILVPINISYIIKIQSIKSNNLTFS
jgi:hypothetical protein